MKTAEQARELLAHEFAHRIKNVFSLLGAIASMSARGRSAELEVYAADLRGRFRSLSTALTYAQPGISQLARDRRPVTIVALARALLSPFEPGVAHSDRRCGRVGYDETTGLGFSCTNSRRTPSNTARSHARRRASCSTGGTRRAAEGELRLRLEWRERWAAPAGSEPLASARWVSAVS